MGMNQVHFFCLGVEIKQFFHTDSCIVHGPSHKLLLTFDFFIHKISREEKANLWIKLLLSDFFYEASKLKNFNGLSWRIGCLNWSLDTTIFENDLSCIDIKEHMLSSLSFKIPITTLDSQLLHL